MMSQNITLLYCTILKILLIGYIIFFRHPVHLHLCSSLVSFIMIQITLFFQYLFLLWPFAAFHRSARNPWHSGIGRPRLKTIILIPRGLTHKLCILWIVSQHLPVVVWCKWKSSDWCSVKIFLRWHCWVLLPFFLFNSTILNN